MNSQPTPLESGAGSRTEHDFLGEMDLGNQHYYGVQTARALDNFVITGIPMSAEPLFIQAFAMVKKAAAMANLDCGALSPVVAKAITAACDRLVAGALAEFEQIVCWSHLAANAYCGSFTISVKNSLHPASRISGVCKSETKSVSQLTSSKRPEVASALTRAVMTPSLAARSALAPALAIPRSRRSLMEASRSPLVSVRTRLQSIMPALVLSRSSLTIAAVIII